MAAQSMAGQSMAGQTMAGQSMAGQHLRLVGHRRRRWRGGPIPLQACVAVACRGIQLKAGHGSRSGSSRHAVFQPQLHCTGLIARVSGCQPIVDQVRLCYRRF